MSTRRISNAWKAPLARRFLPSESAKDSYRGIPALDELCSRYGDPTNRKIYVMSRDVEGRWMAMHERETDAKAPID
jgi:hypothetical protein